MAFVEPASTVRMHGPNTVRVAVRRWGVRRPRSPNAPSTALELLNKSGPHVVTNYGEGGFVSTQALIRLSDAGSQWRAAGCRGVLWRLQRHLHVVYVDLGGHEDSTAHASRALEAGPVDEGGHRISRGGRPRLPDPVLHSAAVRRRDDAPAGHQGAPPLTARTRCGGAEGGRHVFENAQAGAGGRHRLRVPCLLILGSGPYEQASSHRPASAPGSTKSRARPRYRVRFGCAHSLPSTVSPRDRRFSDAVQR